jgi:hypothetical protein
VEVPTLIIVDPVRGVGSGVDRHGPAVQVWQDELGRKLATCYAIDGRYWVDVPGVARFGVHRPSDAVEAIPYPSAAAEEIDGMAVNKAINNRIADFFIVEFSFDMAFASTAEIPYVV